MILSDLLWLEPGLFCHILILVYAEHLKTNIDLIIPVNSAIKHSIVISKPGIVDNTDLNVLRVNHLVIKSQIETNTIYIIHQIPSIAKSKLQHRIITWSYDLSYGCNRELVEINW